ncbi:MAG: YaaR family protein [Treponema sp.]|nr:YaaR family protein [Treponema sp.]
MDGIETINNPGVFFNASQAATEESAIQAKKQHKDLKSRRALFTSTFERTKAEYKLAQAGLPTEIAGMELEEAVVYLKDAADIAADRLKESTLPENFADYRKKVAQFMRFIVQNNYELKKRRRPGLNRKGRPFDPQVQITVINKKLDDMAKWLISSHKDTLQMLAKVNEIQGLLVDLMAA